MAFHTQHTLARRLEAPDIHSTVPVDQEQYTLHTISIDKVQTLPPEFCKAIRPGIPIVHTNLPRKTAHSHRKPLIFPPQRTLAAAVKEWRSRTCRSLDHHVEELFDRDTKATLSTHLEMAETNIPSGHPPVRDVNAQDSSDSTLTSVTAGPANGVPVSGSIPRGRIIIDTMDEDALPVDHPRRAYDLVDFLSHWRYGSSWDGPPPPEHPDARKLQESRLPLSQIIRHDAGSSLDLQGIDWSLLDRTRNDVLLARVALHPSRLAAQARRLNSRVEQEPEDVQIERYYRFASLHTKRKMHISHFQLRHLMSATDRSAVYCAAGNEVMKSSLALPPKNEAVMKLANNFRITSMNVSKSSAFSEYKTDNVLIAGGFNGEYAMLNLGQGRHSPIEGYVAQAEDAFVTHVHSFSDRRSGNLQAVFCTNNQQVRVLDARTLQWTHSFSHQAAINCSVTSPDSRLRALAGDMNDILITDAEKGDIHVRLQGHTDHAFVCAWSPDGRNVATGSQDSTVRVWDSRNWSRSLATLPSVMTCPRSLHFTDDCALVVAENEDVVSIHDTSIFSLRQDLRFFGAIAGVAVLDGGAEIVVANADRTVGGLMLYQRTCQGFVSEIAARHSRSGGSPYRGRSQFLSDVIV